MSRSLAHPPLPAMRAPGAAQSPGLPPLLWGHWELLTDTGSGGEGETGNTLEKLSMNLLHASQLTKIY